MTRVCCLVHWLGECVQTPIYFRQEVIWGALFLSGYYGLPHNLEASLWTLVMTLRKAPLNPGIMHHLPLPPYSRSDTWSILFLELGRLVVDFHLLFYSYAALPEAASALFKGWNLPIYQSSWWKKSSYLKLNVLCLDVWAHFQITVHAHIFCPHAMCHLCVYLLWKCPWVRTCDPCKLNLIL